MMLYIIPSLTSASKYFNHMLHNFQICVAWFCVLSLEYLQVVWLYLYIIFKIKFYFIFIVSDNNGTGLQSTYSLLMFLTRTVVISRHNLCITKNVDDFFGPAHAGKSQTIRRRPLVEHCSNNNWLLSVLAFCNTQHPMWPDSKMVSSSVLAKGHTLCHVKIVNMHSLMQISHTLCYANLSYTLMLNINTLCVMGK